ncbi:MAG: sulfurtransferase TusA family protein [Promethearchaeota archaeon]
MADENLDTTGMVCPMPAFKTKKALENLGPGDMLKVIGDFPEAVPNIVRVVENAGHAVLKKVVKDGKFEIHIKKK